LESTYTKLNGNGATMLKGHNPHLGLPESRSIKLENGQREEKIQQ
jgi:hypothetical protein